LFFWFFFLLFLETKNRKAAGRQKKKEKRNQKKTTRREGEKVQGARDKVEKYNLEPAAPAAKNPLTKIIAEIINDNKLDLRDKQLAVEKALINFDLNWLENEGLYSSSVKNTILHDIYGKIDKGLIDLLDNYRRNNYKELKYVSLRQHILPPVYTRAGGREDLCSLLPSGFVLLFFFFLPC
jgi:hypothetical protein